MTPASSVPLSHLTPAQREAVGWTAGSLLVSAAAGSGKTTVLAERCVALVCDVEPDRRCNIDELLVVTFTDAAAEEMRSRIRATLRKRLEADGGEDLQHQLYRLETASISTIHAFCKTLIERYFPQAGVDPQAAVLSQEEADLLREEVLDELFLSLYAASGPEALAFQGLVDDYGGGNDAPIRRIVLQVHDFISTLPDPEDWLERSLRRLAVDGAASPDGLLATLDQCQCRRIGEELRAQIDYGRHLAGVIRAAWPVAAMHAEGLDEHVSRLEGWLSRLDPNRPKSWAAIAEEIRDFTFERAPSRPRGLDDETKAAFDAAKEWRDEAKRLFATRLQERLCRFTADEYRDGLARTAPAVRTLVHLVRGFDVRYADAKDARAVVDFNDLQRRAFRLLADPADPDRPSDVARRLQRQFRYVLVDEFQDIDPLQERILRLVSRETADPPAGNLFTVGDIKQSIYRFRLAEPRLFSERAERFARDAAAGRLIHLQSNFRSRSPVIDAINLVFESLMSRDFGGSPYDDGARLRAGAAYPDAPGGATFNVPAVELFLLEPVTERTRVAPRAVTPAPANRTADEGRQRNAAGVEQGAEGFSPRGLATAMAPTAAPLAEGLVGDETGDGQPPSPEEDLAGIEREAFLIGRRILSWMGLGKPASGAAPPPRRQVLDKPAAPGGPPTYRPIEYRDVVILLRSLPFKAEPIADVLRRMHLPVRIERQSGDVDTTEFRDCVSALRLMDNLQQDVPLAAVLRSPLLGDPFSETDLLDVRLADRDAPFHEAVRRYAETGPDAKLRGRVRRVLDILDRYRTRVARTPVADVLWELYEEFDYLGYVSGLPDADRRRDTLVRLHELARQFGRFSRQGLRRFLHFLDDLCANQREPRRPVAGGDDDCIRIMTIHASKGLEFPVVILADCQKRFNLEDLGGNLLLDRENGIALRASDPERRIFYPTLAHQLAVETALREGLSEELRVLYVALTRAREHLVLTGRISPQRVEFYRLLQQAVASEVHPSGGSGGGRNVALPRLRLECSTNPLDWVLSAVAAAPADRVRWPGQPSAGGALFEITAFSRRETDAWRVPSADDPQRAEVLARLADLDGLPQTEPVEGLDEARRLVNDLAAPYPARALAGVPARMSVGEFERRWDSSLDPDERRPWLGRRVKPPRPAFMAEGPRDDPTARGTATHRFLQFIDLTRPCTADDLKAQLLELLDRGRLTPAEADAVLLDGAAWLFTTDLGRHIRAHAAAVRREVGFEARIEPQRYDPRVVGLDPRDVILVRGTVDLIVPCDEGLEIIDYKTDRLAAADCPQRGEEYRPQLEAYARAVRDIYRTPIRRCRLVFLHPRVILDVSAPTGP
ncbi:MAG: UvrD-helicase domain-containing protein [Phycisphaerae bacterium]|jgi:ATP-dependent helicase/nuclease subunit A